MLVPIEKKRKIYEDVVQQLTRKIESGEFKIGDKLPTERELVSMMNISRTSIREALRAMELMGMLESRVGDGTYVKGLHLERALSNVLVAFNADSSFISDMYDVRILLESYTIKMAARSHSEEQLDKLRQAMEMMRKDIALGNLGLEGDNLFHRAIAETAGNKALISILSLCSDLFNSSIELANTYIDKASIVREHQEMYDAIEAKNVPLAVKLMKDHIRVAQKRARLLQKGIIKP